MPSTILHVMWNKLFGCVSETLEISSQSEEDCKSNPKSLKNSLNNLTNGSYTNLTNPDEISKQQASIVQKLADSAGRLNKLDKLASPDKSAKKEKKKEEKKKLSQASTSITMTTNTVASKKKLVTSEIAPQFSRKQNEAYAQ